MVARRFDSSAGHVSRQIAVEERRAVTAMWTPTSIDRVSPTALQPLLGPLVDGDLCDIRIGRGICGRDAERLVLDVDGRERLLCPACVRLYFPAELVAA